MSNIGDVLLPGLPHDLIIEKYSAAPGNEILSGKFCNPESSSCLVANAFGLFFKPTGNMPPLPGLAAYGTPLTVTPEVIVRFPWRGGRHPCLDLLIETNGALIGVESKRYEPFRSKSKTTLSDAYRRDVWGDQMSCYRRALEDMRQGTIRFEMLDAIQLVKHAFGLRTAAHRKKAPKQPVLHYLYAEPKRWPDGRQISDAEGKLHRAEVQRFAGLVEGDEVQFHACTYQDLLSAWAASPQPRLQAHSAALLSRFDVVRP